MNCFSRRSMDNKTVDFQTFIADGYYGDLDPMLLGT